MNHTQNYLEQQEAKRLQNRISSFLEDFKIGALLGGSGIRKLRGANPLAVFDTIFSLPIGGVNFSRGIVNNRELVFSKDAAYRVIFSGDLGCTDTPIPPVPDPPEHCDLLILESTYGDRRHPNWKNRIEALRNLLYKALADKGIVYIPAFALGRTQELLYELDRIGVNVQVFVDSPLGIEITKIYSSLDPYWDQEAKDLSAKGDHSLDF